MNANLPQEIIDNVNQIETEENAKLDKYFMLLYWGHFLLASFIIPIGYNSYKTGLIIGGLAAILSTLTYFLFKGSTFSRHIMAFIMMLFSALFIQLQMGRIEMHFHVFVGLAALLIYRDFRVILTAAGVIAVHHAIFNYLQDINQTFFDTKIMVFNYGCGWDIVLLHAVFVIAESAILIYYAIKLRNQFHTSVSFKEQMRHVIEQNQYYEILPFNDNDKEELSLIGSVNCYTFGISDLLAEIKRVIKNNQSINLDLSNKSNESSSIILDINEEFEKITGNSNKLENEIKQSDAATSDLKAFIKDLTQNISNQAASVSESSASIEEITASIGNITKVSEEKLKTVSDLESIALSSNEGMKKSMENINKVANSASVIMEMIHVINGIAEQTNLLAMNAAIEAAHAGDYGKGFAVVADEIRKLAEDSSKNSKEISNSLKDIIDHIHTSEEVIENTGESFLKIVDRIVEVTGGMEEIKTSLEEINNGNQQMLTVLGSLVDISQNVSNSSNEMSVKVEQISNAIGLLVNASIENKRSTDIVKTKLMTLEKLILELNQDKEKNSESINKMNEIIAKLSNKQSATKLSLKDPN